MELVSVDDVRGLLTYFSKYPYKLKENSKVVSIEKKCEELFAKDYKVFLIDNSNGELTHTYPSQLIIPQRNVVQHSDSSDQHIRSKIFTEDVETTTLRETIMKARGARCRTRFPVPVISYEEKYICRSATISCGAEIYGREALGYFFAGGSGTIDNEDELMNSTTQSTLKTQPTASEWQLFSKVRNQDIKLLKQLDVGYICDLMVEKKKVKFGVNVTSSEKVDKENRYSDFVILSLPYPGCEFFVKFRDNNYSGEKLVFDWTQDFVNAQLIVPNDDIGSHLEIPWNDYREWDLVILTKNYLKLLLKYIFEGTSGLLIHCISGWDRTPLFISLLRLSLWADGKVHPSLTCHEITFLTIAYDWFLFGHNLPDRLNKGEEIMFFCFYFLKYLNSEEFSSFHINKERFQKDSDGNISEIDPGILLENSGAHGSNTSLNSCSSSVSSRSQDNPPAYFSMPCQDSGDEMTATVHSNGNIPSNMQSYYPHPCHRVVSCPQPIAEDASEETIKNQDGNRANNLKEGDNYYLQISTSPVAVPNSIRQRSESTSSIGCGSWQFITGTGSVRDSASTRSSISSPTRELNQNANRQSTNQAYQDPERSPRDGCPQGTRREKLEKVRTIFYNCYSAAIGFHFKNGTEPGQSLFDHLAEKVGIRSAWTSTV
ncbi:myotubularin-related protein 14 isoform X2 [Centruroides vittatus]|uniref:myotubularin-related protein 14 isoform X2 n=1 Tax=Centruroides vittatus TaxID=120091 RepID=UPI00350F3503